MVKKPKFMFMHVKATNLFKFNIMSSIEKHLKIAFKAYKRNIITILFSVFFSIVIFICFLFFSIFLILSGIQNVQDQQLVQPDLTLNKVQSLFLLDLGNIFFVILILGFSIVIVLSCGLFGVCYYSVNKKVSISVFFRTIRERIIPYFFATSLILSIYFLIFLFFLFLSIFVLKISLLFSLFILITLLFVSPFLLFYAPAIISGSGAIDSIRKSFSIGEKHYFNLIILILIFFLLSFIELIPIVGFIVEYFLLLPLLQITISSFYIEKTKKLGKITKSKRSKKKK